MADTLDATQGIKSGGGNATFSDTQSDDDRAPINRATRRAAVRLFMRRRSQQEMDQLVAEAGFETVRQRIDTDGIFSVSLARRI